MRILVTGCTGFVGSALIKVLLSDGNTVFCASRSSSCAKNHSMNHFSLDLSLPFCADQLPSDLECIVHAAASMDKTLSCAQMFAANVVSTLQLLEFGKKSGIKKFVFISSGAVYGYNDQPICETDAPKPSEFYGVTKHHAEMLVNCFSTCFDTSILRLFYPYGEGQTKGIIPWLYNSIVARRPITIHRHDTPQINPVHISDVVHAIVRVMHSGKNFTLNISGNEIVTIRDIADIISSILGTHYDILQSNNDMGNMVGSNRLLVRELGIDPVISLSEGLKMFCDSMRE